MNDPRDLEMNLYIFILAGFLGYRIISRVPPLLHTPLMSATNAISGISLIGSLVIAGAQYDALSSVLGLIAVASAATNVVGGFLITDRMLRMFRTGDDQPKRRVPAWLAGGGALAVLGGVAVVMWEERLRAGQEILRYLYLVSAVLFIVGLQGLTVPRRARTGMRLAALGMAVAIVATLFHDEIKSYTWIIIGLTVGTIAGAIIGLRCGMTAVPQRTAFSHALGALAATLVGISEFVRHRHGMTTLMIVPLGFEVIVGGLTFTGSLIAAAKLQELMRGAPITYRGQNLFSGGLLGALIVGFVVLVAFPDNGELFFALVGLSLLFGCMLVMPIGAADMPVVIALLNSYAGLAGAAMGFVLLNRIQIITGSLDGASGFILSLLMCRAMNRSATNVLFGAFGAPIPKGEGKEPKGIVRSITPEELAVMFEGVRLVVIVPGYGMAVAQAQHVVSDLAHVLLKRGVDVRFAIHPVAGRMPGHMNVLLAEANIPYDRLYEMEQINPMFPDTDVALVVGANDVTNPAAKTDKTSPLYGMPILDVERARSIIVLKRGMRPGFAGVDNELYFDPKCLMLFGDAKETLTKLLSAMKD